MAEATRPLRVEPLVVPLVLPQDTGNDAGAAADLRRRVGSKAARLAELGGEGFPVPPGFVVTTEAGRAFAGWNGIEHDAPPEEVEAGTLPPELEAEVRRAVAALGDAPVAVRSSAVAEDRADSSFAGIYESVVGVRGAEEILRALRRVWASAHDPRVRAYGRDGGGCLEMAVLVQRLIDAEAAGVAFTADPVTGARDVVLVSAVAGLGEGLVSGERSAEEWRIEDGQPRRPRDEGVLDEADVRRIATLAKRIEEGAGEPQDVEWALESGTLHLLQARPMTALPEPVEWDAPPGCWMRNFRLGEWIGDPVTPSFESWLLTGIEESLHRYIVEVCGVGTRRPHHIVVNGWYFYGGLNVPGASELLRAVPRMLLRLATRFREFAALVPPIAHLGFDWAARHWEERLRAAYLELVEEAEGAIDTVPVGELPGWIDRLAEAAGRQFGSILGVGGYAAKAELKLWAIWSEALHGLDGSPLELVHSDDADPARRHAVQGLDWIHPTLGELPLEPAPPDPGKRAKIRARREELERAARAVLAARPRLLERFDRVLTQARRAHDLREAQSDTLTLPWPALRRAMGRIGEHLAERGILEAAEEVFFLTKGEIEDALVGGSSEGLAARARDRRRAWDRQRRLSPPLVLGEVPRELAAMIGRAERAMRGETTGAEVLQGYPGSPGRASGRVRVIRSLDELHRLRPGEILVAPVTTPAWTPAFSLAAAIITDTGSIGSHSSIVAREYGLPAVVATGDATTRLHDGDQVRVDGNRGVVERVEA